jgi:uncharacterized protein YndB with AHSA1/START domain
MSVPGDQVRVSVLVAVPAPEAFRVFTEDLDRWWRKGLKYRVAGSRSGTLQLEGHLGGRLLESYLEDGAPRVFEAGRVTAWEPGARLVLDWRVSNFAPGERTEVEVTFAPSSSGTLVTVTHRGWSRLRPDHPVRHGLEVAAFLRQHGLWWGELLSSLRELVGR